MKFEFPINTFQCFQKFAADAGYPSRMVAQVAAPAAGGGVEDEEAETPAGADEAEREARLAREAEERRREARRNRREMEHRIAAADFSDDTKELMRECLVSSIADEKTERVNLVEDLLDRRIDEARFRYQLDAMQREDDSWSVIFHTQREIRKQIWALQWRTESYIEYIPRGKEKFESLLKGARSLNCQDDTLDRSLKRELSRLTEAREGTAALLHPEQAREIYNADPVKEGPEKTLKKYRTIIESAEGGRLVYKRLLAYKKEEMRIERQFNQLYNSFENIVVQNLQKARSKAERERLVKMASRTVGITLKPGTKIKFDYPDILQLGADKDTVTITEVTFDPVQIRDPKTGKVIDQINGAPIVHLDNGAALPIGRFKKWIDVAGGVEQVSSLEDAEQLLELNDYGIKIKEGMELFYPKRTRNERGDLEVHPAYVRITAISGNRIKFSEPVLFQPGYAGIDKDEMRQELSIDEFVKWWRRYEVEASVDLEELRQNLRIFNKNVNKAYGKNEKENPPILVQQGEQIRYPDESGTKYVILNVDDGVTLNNGERFAYPEFFYWVKNNNIERIPERDKTVEEVKDERERDEFVESAKKETESAAEEARAQGEKRYADIKKDAKKRAAGSFIEKLKETWFQTQFLSVRDLWNMIKEVVEFVKRKHERRSKGRYGQVGSRLPWVIGPEFERVKQSAENEEVNKYKEAMEQWSVEKVKRTLHDTNSKDIAKACILTLLHHGEMRWDDQHFWKTLNRLTARYTLRGAELYIPEAHLIPPGQSGEDMVEPAINALWGAGQGSSWFQENISKYNSNKNNFEYEFKNLEADPKGTGGPSGECERLLKVWRDGGYVNPQKYEEMIDGAIKYGKMSAEDKMFFIIAGCVMRQGKDPHGETLLSLDRPGELDSKYLNQFPLLDFFTQGRVVDYTLWDETKDNGPGKPKGGWGKKRKFQLRDYEHWKNEYFPNDFEACKPGKQFSRFMWEVMLMDEMVRTRISKGIRNAENMDHDDAHLYIPPTTPTEVDSITTGPTGQKKYFTNAGYANGLAGFNQYIVALSYSLEEETDEDRKKDKSTALRDTINAFIRYDAILDNRFLKADGDKRARLDDRHMQRASIVDFSDGCKLQVHRDQLRNLVLEIGKAYGQDWHTWLYGQKTGSYFDPKEKQKQDEYERRLDSLKDMISRLYAQDNGKKILDIVRRMRARAEVNDKDPFALRGLTASKRPPRDEILKLRQQAREKAAKQAH